MSLPKDRSKIATEQRNEATKNLHQLEASEVVKLMIAEDKAVFQAMEKAAESIAKVVENIVSRFQRMGRIIYIGAGTSGRLGVLDASEIPPTFLLPENRVIGIIAGGDSALRKSSEGMEDIYLGSQEELLRLNLTENDTVIGITAGGTTPYAIGALDFSKQINKKTYTVLISCSPVNKDGFIDDLILLDTGPEVVTGSTRLKAGSATKMCLNTISTSVMIAIGRVYENLMVDVKASNEKLVDRAIRIVQNITHLSREDSYQLIVKANYEVKVAIVMFFYQFTYDQANGWLKSHGDSLKNLKTEEDRH